MCSGKLKVRVKIIIGIDEIRMCVGNLPIIIEIEIGGIQKFWFDKTIGAIIIELPRGTMDSRTGIGLKWIIVDSIVITDDDISPEKLEVQMRIEVTEDMVVD
ncbi:hypothetical protein TNCV_4208321 [Trichonephila clavipes]|nr:hypothetical protein TNCV_4208321 [Trichonephila clavipes]